MKRLLVFLLLVCMSGAALAACGGGPDVTGDTVSEVISDSAETTAGTAGAGTAEAVTTEETSGDYFDATRIEIVKADASKVADLTVLDDGCDIYQLPGSGNGGWRYGPSYIYYGDGRVDAYFASGGDSGEWDRITHRSSTDDGKAKSPSRHGGK